MFQKKEWIAMLLAGGQGSRLHPLTRNIAKPAVPFGGKYRIIDFPLSNCVNSGVDTVGVLTQYQPLVLNEYIGNGQPWDLDRVHGGVFILPPYQKSKHSDWYTGTANAIFQNIPFIERYNPEYVLILSGDHIYQMDYSKMLRFHKEKGAECTIAVIDVPLEEASRFGIMSVDPTMRITRFSEKPKQPESTLASMGIYIFNWGVLKKYLEADDQNPRSSKDFGKDVIPTMLADGRGLYAYSFEGYWKDVGTLDSLWEANMDLLDPNVRLELYDERFKIYPRNPGMPPHYISNEANVQNAIITEGCYVAGNIEFSVLFAGVTVERGAEVTDSIIMPGVTIKSGAKVQYAMIAEDTVVEEGAVIGERPERVSDKEKWGISVVAGGVTVGKNAVVRAKTLVENDVKEGEVR